MKHNGQLIEALRRAETPPCETFRCPKQWRCAEQKLACGSFRHFVLTGKSVDPRMIWPAIERGSFRTEMGDVIDPTRAMYDEIHSEDRDYVKREVIEILETAAANQ